MKAQFEKKTYYFFSKFIDKLQPYPTMFHPHIEHFYVTHGPSQVVVEGTRYTLEKDELILVFPYVVHEYKRSPDVLGKLVMFSPSVCPDYEKTFLTMRPKNPRNLTLKKSTRQIFQPRKKRFNTARHISAKTSHSNPCRKSFLFPKVKSPEYFQPKSARRSATT